MPRPYRNALQGAVASSAGPYGYTLTLWCSGILAVEKLGHPVLGDVLLLAGGAILAFMLLAAVAYGAVRFTFVAREPTQLGVWAHTHLLSAMAAASAVWVVVPVVSGAAGWALTGFLASSVYLLGYALQTLLASRPVAAAPPVQQESVTAPSDAEALHQRRRPAPGPGSASTSR